MGSYYLGYWGGHFLESCTLCRKSLLNSDIFMYRGDKAFCSEECREEQIECDEAEEKKKKKKYKTASSRSLLKSSDSKDSVTGKTLRTETLVEA